MVSVDEFFYGNTVRLYGGNLQIHPPGFCAEPTGCRCCRWKTPMKVVQFAMVHPEVQLASKHIRTAGMINNRGESYPVTITDIQPSPLVKSRRGKLLLNVSSVRPQARFHLLTKIH